MQDVEMVFSVSELNQYVSALLSADPHLRELTVRGEISGFKRHSSGHLYFTLKDENASVACVMFRTYAQQLAFRPEDGQQVRIHGSASIYAKDGRFQVYVTGMESAGAGELYAKFMQLKARLEKEGLFDPAHKKEVPYLPKTLGVVTSGTGAALQDILNITKRRFPDMNITLCPVKVQGEGAAHEIACAIRTMNRMQAADVLIVGRGGGSIEDLWAFNEEEVARAIFESDIPVISAVGHETDFTIADFTADLRAPTPSAAAELAVPEYEMLRYTLKDYGTRLCGVLERNLEKRRDKLKLLVSGPAFMQLEMRIADSRKNLDDWIPDMQKGIAERLSKERMNLEKMKKQLDALSPDAVLQRGFSVVRNADGTIIRSASFLKPGEDIQVRFFEGEACAEVKEITEG